MCCLFFVIKKKRFYIKLVFRMYFWKYNVRNVHHVLYDTFLYFISECDALSVRVLTLLLNSS